MTVRHDPARRRRWRRAEGQKSPALAVGPQRLSLDELWHAVQLFELLPPVELLLAELELRWPVHGTHLAYRERLRRAVRILYEAAREDGSISLRELGRRCGCKSRETVRGYLGRCQQGGWAVRLAPDGQLLSPWAEFPRRHGGEHHGWHVEGKYGIRWTRDLLELWAAAQDEAWHDAIAKAYRLATRRESSPHRVRCLRSWLLQSGRRAHERIRSAYLELLEEDREQRRRERRERRAAQRDRQLSEPRQTRSSQQPVDTPRAPEARLSSSSAPPRAEGQTHSGSASLVQTGSFTIAREAPGGRGSDRGPTHIREVLQARASAQTENLDRGHGLDDPGGSDPWPGLTTPGERSPIAREDELPRLSWGDQVRVQWASELVRDRAAALGLHLEVLKAATEVGEPAPATVFAELLRLAEHDRSRGLDWWVGRYRRAVDGVREAHAVARARGEPCRLRQPAAVAWHRCRCGWIGAGDQDAPGSKSPQAASSTSATEAPARDPEQERGAVVNRPLSQREGVIRMQLELAERGGHEQLVARLREQLAEAQAKAARVETNPASSVRRAGRTEAWGDA